MAKTKNTSKKVTKKATKKEYNSADKRAFRETDEWKEFVKVAKKEIENYCIIVANNTTQSNVCYLKNIGDEEIKEIRYQLIEYLAGNNGVKKQQIKTFLKEKNIILQDNKLNKLLKSIGEYTNSQWVIKSPK